MKKLLCLMIVLLLALTAFAACGESEETTKAPASSQNTPVSSSPADSSSTAPDSSSTAPDSSSTAPDSSSTAPDSSSTSDEPDEPDEPDTPDTPDTPTVDEAIDLLSLLASSGYDLIGDVKIEDHHGFNDGQPALTFYIDADDAGTCADVLGTGYTDPDAWTNPKYKWVLTVNGEELIPEKFSVWDDYFATDNWAYFRADLGPVEDYEYVDEKFTFSIKLEIVDVATQKVKYYAEFEDLVHNTGMIEDESKPEGIVAVDDVSPVSGPAEGDSEGYEMALDGDIKTKLCTDATDAIVATFARPVRLVGMSLVNANDNDPSTDRTVIAFELWVSEDGENWGTAAAWSTDGAGVNQEDVSENFKERFYGFDTSIEATYVKLVINHDGLYQFCEVVFYQEGESEPELDPRSQYLTVEQMAEITANETACQIKQHVGPTLDANGGFYVGISSDGNPFAAGTVEGTHGLGNTLLTKLYLNGEEITITDGMYTTAAHWEIRIALDPAKLQAENEIVFSLAAKDMENNNCNHDNYYCIFTVPKA